MVLSLCCECPLGFSFLEMEKVIFSYFKVYGSADYRVLKNSFSFLKLNRFSCVSGG